MIGRVIDPLGNPIDGKGEDPWRDLRDALERQGSRGVIFRQPVNEPLPNRSQGRRRYDPYREGAT